MSTELLDTELLDTGLLDTGPLDTGPLDTVTLDKLLGDDYSSTRKALIHHPLWEALKHGQASDARLLAQLRAFALQDHWLVTHSMQLEALLLAHATDEAARELLAGKLSSKQVFTVGDGNLVRFGKALGLSQDDFEKVEPLPGCAALTTHFYYALARDGFLGMLTAITVSESVFIAICDRAGPALQRQLGLSSDYVAFFTLHNELKTPVDNLEAQLIARLANTDEARTLVKRAAHRSFGFEKLFYDTIFAVGQARD